MAARSSSRAGAIAIEVGLDGSTSSVAAAASSSSSTTTTALNFCSDTNCFASLVHARADAHRTIVLAMTNKGFVPFWHNLRCSMERLDVAKHAIIIGTDEAACLAATSPTVPCVVGEKLLLGNDAASLSSSAEKHGTKEYAKLMHVKARPALAVLKLGYNLIFTDTDVVWLRNPLRDLRATYGARLDEGQLDVLIQSDHDESNEIPSCSKHEDCRRSMWCSSSSSRKSKSNKQCEAEVCGGFYYLRPSAQSISLLERLFDYMAWQREHVDERLGEQPALNYVLRRGTPHPVRYDILPRALYPNGNAYFARGLRPTTTALGPVIIHNNWLAGFEAKRQRFVAHGMWYVEGGGFDSTSAQCVVPEDVEDAGVTSSSMPSSRPASAAAGRPKRRKKQRRARTVRTD